MSEYDIRIACRNLLSLHTNLTDAAGVEKRDSCIKETMEIMLVNEGKE